MTLEKESSKTITTLVDDIYGLFGSDKVEIKPEYLEKFSTELAELISERLSTDRGKSEKILRLSSIGKPDRRLWFDVNWTGEVEELSPEAQIKFAYGDILEHLMLLFARQAGHTVEFEQVEVEVEGIKGHPDCIIDGVVVDVKSAASHQFDKFASGNLEAFEKDIFLTGYLDQLAGYVEALNPEADGAFLVIDKTLGKVCLMMVPNEVIKQIQIRKRIQHKKEVVKLPEPPEKCYEPVPEGKSGNFRLASGCSYCSHKFHCWSDANGGQGLRTFLYSNGPKFFTHVEKEPRVFEGSNF